jgi:hypothetical protein
LGAYAAKITKIDSQRCTRNLFEPNLIWYVVTSLDFRSTTVRERAADPQEASHGNRRVLGLISVGALIAVCVLAILVDSALYYNKVHSGVSVSGVDLGGQSKDEAVASLTALVDQAQSSPITLTAGQKTWTLMPDDAGTNMDVEGAVKAAMAVSRRTTSSRMWVPGSNCTSAGATCPSTAVWTAPSSTPISRE